MREARPLRTVGPPQQVPSIRKFVGLVEGTVDDDPGMVGTLNRVERLSYSTMNWWFRAPFRETSSSTPEAGRRSTKIVRLIRCQACIKGGRVDGRNRRREPRSSRLSIAHLREPSRVRVTSLTDLVGLSIAILTSAKARSSDARPGPMPAGTKTGDGASGARRRA